MLLHSAPFFQIYFGNSFDNIHKPSAQLGITSSTILHHEPYKKLVKAMSLDRLIFLHQVHAAHGLLVSRENASDIIPFSQDGDYLITQVPHVGIGIMTGDCLPIVCFDSRNVAIGIAHAGWRSSIQKIAIHMVEHMQREYGTQIEHMKFFFGPSAKACCYQVTGNFASQLDPFPFAEHVMVEQEDGIFFNVPEFNRLLLESIGVPRQAVHLDYNLCTIDEKSFCSARRQKENAGRQMTVVALK